MRARCCGPAWVLTGLPAMHARRAGGRCNHPAQDVCFCDAVRGGVMRPHVNYGTLKSPFMFMCEEFAPIKGTEHLILPACRELFGAKLLLAAMASFEGSMFSSVWSSRLGAGMRFLLRLALVSHEAGSVQEANEVARGIRRGWGVGPGCAR